jgi:acyl-CoA thioester hydrolase
LKEHWNEVRVTYAQTDQMMGVHHSRYFEYFEIARTELFRSFGYSYKEFEESGFMLPLVEAHINFKRQAKYDDILKIKSYVDGDASVKMKIQYEIYVEDKLICTGFTSHAFVKKDSFRATRAPEHFVKLLV